jgi:hypothetical protein
MSFEKIFPGDKISKLERVTRTLNHQPVDRVALHDQIINPGVISLYTGEKIDGFKYGEEEIGRTVRKTLDMCFQLFPPRGKRTARSEDGIVYQHDEWTTWIESRPFNDEKGAAEWLKQRIKALRDKESCFDDQAEKEKYAAESRRQQKLIGDTVLCRYHDIGLCKVWSSMGIDIFSFFHTDYAEIMDEYMELYASLKIRWIKAVADPSLSPVVLIADDFASKNGSVFGENILGKYLFAPLARMASEWKNRGHKVLFHSDGNWKKFIPQLLETGVDGFYCLEPACGMDIVELKKQHPEAVWAGGLDGVDLMERGMPEQVRLEAVRQITESNVLREGGMFLASSSEINPAIKPENFKAMVDAAGECRNEEFSLSEK